MSGGQGLIEARQLDLLRGGVGEERSQVRVGAWRALDRARRHEVRVAAQVGEGGDGPSAGGRARDT